MGVDVLVAGVGGLELGLVADGNDGVAVDGNRAVLEVGLLGVSGDDATIADNKHGAPFIVAGGG